MFLLCPVKWICNVEQISARKMTRLDSATSFPRPKPTLKHHGDISSGRTRTLVCERECVRSDEIVSAVQPRPHRRTACQIRYACVQFRCTNYTYTYLEACYVCYLHVRKNITLNHEKLAFVFYFFLFLSYYLFFIHSLTKFPASASIPMYAARCCDW